MHIKSIQIIGHSQTLPCNTCFMVTYELMSFPVWSISTLESLLYTKINLSVDYTCNHWRPMCGCCKFCPLHAPLQGLCFIGFVQGDQL